MPSGRLRKLTVRMMKLSQQSPTVMGNSIKFLGRKMKKGELTRTEYTSIFLSPLTNSTLLSALSGLTRGKVPLERFMKRINDSYEKRIPENRVNDLLECRKRSFHKKLFQIEIDFHPPKSFGTAMIIARAVRLAEAGKISIKIVKEAKRIGWNIHEKTHKAKVAQRRGDKIAEKRVWQDIHALEARQAEICKIL